VLLVVSDMTAILRWRNGQEGARRADREASSNALVGLMRAQDGLRVQLDPTGDRAAVKSTIENLPVSGKAGCWRRSRSGRRRRCGSRQGSGETCVLFITDSDVTNYREDFTNPTINYSDSAT